MIDIDKIPAGVLSDVRQYVRDNGMVRPHDVSNARCDEVIRESSMEDVLDMYLKWNGIIGYTRDILRCVEALQAASR